MAGPGRLSAGLCRVSGAELGGEGAAAAVASSPRESDRRTHQNADVRSLGAVIVAGWNEISRSLG